MVETRMNAYQLAWEAIGLFLEYRDVYGCSEQDAQHHAASDILAGTKFEVPTTRRCPRCDEVITDTDCESCLIDLEHLDQ